MKMKRHSSVVSIIASCAVLLTIIGWLTISSQPIKGSPQQENEGIVSKSFLDVFGRDPNAAELSNWVKTMRDEHIGYDTIVVRHLDWLVSDDGISELKATITRSFQRAFGRDPNQTELDGWVNAVRTRRVTFANIVHEHVNFLISEVGTQELTETIKRSFQIAFHNDPSNEELTAWKRGVKTERIPYAQIVLRHFEWKAGRRPENKISLPPGEQPCKEDTGFRGWLPGFENSKCRRSKSNNPPKQACSPSQCPCYCNQKKRNICAEKRFGNCLEGCDYECKLP